MVLFCNLVCVYEYIYVRNSSLAFVVFFIVKSENKRLPETNFAACEGEGGIVGNGGGERNGGGGGGEGKREGWGGEEEKEKDEKEKEKEKGEVEG